MTYQEPTQAESSFQEPDMENVRQIGERSGQPLPAPTPFLDVTFDDEIDSGENPWPQMRTRQEDRRSGQQRRQAILREATDLMADALTTAQEAIEVASIADRDAPQKYAKMLREMASAVEDFENKL